MNFYFYKNNAGRRRGVVGSIPTFQLDDSGSIPGVVINFNFYPETGCVCVLCLCSVLCCLLR